MVERRCSATAVRRSRRARRRWPRRAGSAVCQLMSPARCSQPSACAVPLVPLSGARAWRQNGARPSFAASPAAPLRDNKGPAQPLHSRGHRPVPFAAGASTRRLLGAQARRAGARGARRAVRAGGGVGGAARRRAAAVRRDARAAAGARGGAAAGGVATRHGRSAASGVSCCASTPSWSRRCAGWRAAWRAAPAARSCASARRAAARRTRSTERPTRRRAARGWGAGPCAGRRGLGARAGRRGVGAARRRWGHGRQAAGGCQAARAAAPTRARRPLRSLRPPPPCDTAQSGAPRPQPPRRRAQPCPWRNVSPLSAPLCGLLSSAVSMLL